MPSITVVERSGIERQFSLQTGVSLMEALRNAGEAEILALCGGACACATCHVYVDAQIAALQPAIGPDEDDLLGTSPHRTVRSRLSCQLQITAAWDGASIQIAPED
jgi:2Fe-2S ferredoxin